MFLQLVIFVTEAIGLATTREYFKLLTRHENLVIHAALMSIGMVLIVVGIGLAMFDKFSRQESVFSGMHTVTGRKRRTRPYRRINFECQQV